MATGVRKTASVPRRARDSAAEIHAAVLQLLKAIPVDHLDRRFVALEKWVRGVGKDVRKFLGVPTPPARRAGRRAGPRRTAHHRT